MSNQHSKCDNCYKSHLPEAHDRTILPSEAFSEGYVPEFNQASEDELRTLDDILSQAFTDGASDTMWQDERHIEIFATAKKELQAIIRTEKLKLLNDLDKSMPTAEQLATKYGYHMPEKQYGYKLGLHDIREVIEAERKKLDDHR